MKRLCCLLFCCALFLQAEARSEEVYPRLKIGTKEYVNVRVLSVNPSGIKVRHEAGGGLIRFADLPPDLQKKHGYDPVKAEAHDRAMKAVQQKALADIEKEREAAKTRDATASAQPAIKYPVALQVIQVLDEGCLCSYRRVYRTADTARYELGYLISGRPSTLAATCEAEELIYVTGIPGLVADGVKVTGFIIVTGTYPYETMSGDMRTLYRCEYSPSL